MQKNDELILKIEDMGVDGAGIGKADGMTFFVKDAVIGDVVRAKVMKLKKTYGYARLMELLEASPDRVEPKCPYYRQCGGCQIQALSYEKQLEFKERKVRNNLERIGGFSEIPMEPIVGMEEPYHYRNKAQFPVGTDKDGHIVTGFYAGRTHTIIPNRDCALGLPVNREILDLVIDFMEKYHVSAYDEKTGKGLVRHVLIRCGFTSKEKMVCLIINGKSLPHSEKLVEALRKIDGMTSISINCNTGRTNVILGRKTVVLWGQEYITDQIGEISYEISPVSFYQVNPVQTEKLYGLALEYADLHGEENVWDLYCGIGTISLFLAQKAKQVYGVEIIPQAIENAKRNAVKNGIENAEFFVGKSEEVLPEFYEKEAAAGRKAHADVIVVDPPRKGCDEKLLETIVKMAPDRVVYVSCDSATLARDLKILCENGYELKRVRAVDQFCHTVHTESVCLMERKDK
ncbi:MULTISPECIES: 23S rRNA (uracil(1939)-C(5))-methyltransferase RlmD [Clostridia]|jgi:23S rRNA (uracil1939-C5)-methyltransferase|uniref:23S rRNA (uracil(1939)-C(5))-methyltransferase RlmD n=1 Tax=Clostridia TaxID=186801 RepID=UPI000E511665|nr:MULTISPECIES: 23S rRNA (uracil(1939)-C(5))-methyltransferase RlmD [Clostridia]RHV67788.1 23S rRNA (uracil(1939)-C(5))-methyltransferase RlmD [Roseburia sp. OM02-15]